MTRNERFRITQRAKWHDLLHKLDGFEAILKLLAVILYFVGAVWVTIRQNELKSSAENMELLSPLLRAMMTNAVPAYLLMGAVAHAIVFTYPFGRKAAHDQLLSIGLVNHAGMAPELLCKRRDEKNTKAVIWVFRNYGIPLQTWEEKRTAIETALGITIAKMRYEKGKQRVAVYAVPAHNDLPVMIQWNDNCLHKNSFTLVLGESILGSVTVNLAHIPHILLGGSTGSGKSVLLKLLLMQAVKKGAVVYIADFKGGVDFSPIWHEKCNLCFEERELLNVLDMLVSVLDGRKQLLKEAGCTNLDEFIERTGDCQPRYIFACDEAAELLDKTGKSKEEKELLGQIENRLAIIARQGRAFGIHLILATQRPDASIIPGQIRSNMDCRICGRADNVLSQIILDSTAAAEQIPKDARGRFMLHDGTVFQGYLFDENAL